MENFIDYIKEQESDLEPSCEAKEAMREIQIIANKAIGQMPKTNGFGINNIEFHVINQEKAESGVQMNLEAMGSAVAKNEKHISRMLQKLVANTREDLWKKNIFLEMMYHKIDVSETKLESEDDDNPNIGLKKTLYFNIICAACVFN